MSDNILELQIKNLFSPFSKKAIEILSTIQNSGSSYQLVQFYKYLQGYFEDLQKIRDILQNTAVIASEAPFNSIKIFYELLPHIDISSETQPNLNSLNTFIAFIRQPQQIDWSNQPSRYGIALFVEVLTAVFCLEIVEIADFSTPENQKEAKQISDFIMKFISNNLSDPQYNKFRTIPASIFADILFYLSKVDSTIYTQALDYLNNNHSLKEFSDDKQSIYFYLYSKIHFRNVHDLDKTTQKHLTKLAKIANKVAKSNYDLHCALYKFLTNFVGNLCMSDDSFRSQKGLAGDIFSPAKSILSNNYSGPAFECLALLITFSYKSHEINKQLQHFTKYAKSQDHAYSILKSFIILLIGLNYKAIYVNGEQYITDFHVIKDSHIVNEMFDAVYENSAIYIPHQDLMTEFIAQIAAADIQSFILDKLPEQIFQENSQFLDHNGKAIFGAARILVHPAYHFPIDEKKRLKLIEFFQEKALKLASNYDPTSVDNWTRTVSKLRAFTVKSFVESIILHHNNTNDLYYYNQIESAPLPYNRPNQKTVVTAVINRWKKIFCTNLSSIPLFMENDHPLKCYNQDLISNPILPSAICIIPLAKPSIECIEDLASKVYSESADVSAASIRALQAIIHGSENDDIIGAIMDHMDHFITKKTISSNEVLYRTLYLIELILDSIYFKKVTVNEKHRLLFNKAACIGFCGSSYDIRLRGYNIGKFIEENTNKPSVTTIFDKYSEEISFTTKIDVLSSISYKNYSTSDTSSFGAFDLMQSKYSSLYQFEIAAFGSKLREKLAKEDLAAIRKTILDLLKTSYTSSTASSQKKYVDHLYILNLIIFLFNTSLRPDYTKLVKLASIFIEIMKDTESSCNVNKKHSSSSSSAKNNSNAGNSNNNNECSKYSESSYYALLSEIDPEICLLLVSEFNDLDSHLLLPLLFSLRRRIDNKEINLTNDVAMLILSFLEKTFNIFQVFKFSHTKLTFDAVEPPTCILEQGLFSLLRFSKTMLGFLRNNNQRDPSCPFNRIPVFSKASVKLNTSRPNDHKESDDSDNSDDSDDSEYESKDDINSNNNSNEGNSSFKLSINLDSWQIFLLNISSCHSSIGKAAQSTLTSLMRIFPLSEKIYSQFLHNLNLFDMNAKVMNALLMQSILYMQYPYMYLLSEFIINEAHSKCSYFKALSSLFREASSVDQVLKEIEQSMRNDPTQQERSFYDIIFKHSGSLLALSFYYILLSDGLERGAGFRVLQSISIGLAVANHKVTPKMCHRIEELRPHIINSQHSNTALESCATLSNVLAEEFSFLSEQFVFSIFSVISKEKSLALIVLPWIKKVNFSSSNDHITVLTATETYFRMFTTDTFVTCLISLPSSKNVLRIIAKAIEEQSEGSLDVFEFIMIKIFSSKLHIKENAKRYATIIVYLYTIYPEKVLNMITKILDYQFWHYHQVQINKLDALFDISKFLSQLSSATSEKNDSTNSNSSNEALTSSDKKGSVKKMSSMNNNFENSMPGFYAASSSSFLATSSTNFNSNPNMATDIDAEIDEEDDNVYKTTVTFVLSILHYCVNEKKEPFEPFLPELILFTFVNIHEYPDMTLPILSALLPFDGSDDEELHKYILGLDLSVRERLSIESLSWGLCCGDFDIALNGLAFFNFVGLEVTNGIADAVLKSLFVVSTCLYERTHKIQMPAEKQWLYQVLDMKKEPDYKLTMFYVENLIDILSKGEPREDVFRTVVSILNLCGDESSVVLNACIIFITKMLSYSSDFAESMSKAKMYSGFKGIIPMIAGCCFDQDTPHYFLDLFKVLKNSKADLKKLGYNVDETKYLYQALDAILNVVESEISPSLTGENSLSKYPVDDLNVILMLLTQITPKTKGNKASLIYDMCCQILATDVADEIVANFAKAVKTDKSSANFHAMNELFKAINKHGVELNQQQQLPMIGKPSFPKLYFDIDYEKMMEEEKNPVNSSALNVTSLPYLLPSDTGFLNCPIMSKVKTSVERFLAQPYTDWSDLMFKCCSVELEEKVIDDKNLLTFKPVPKEAFKKWAHEIAIYVEDNDEDDKVVLYNVQKPKPKQIVEVFENQIDGPDAMEINTIVTVTTDLFLPTNDVIEHIGTNNILKDVDLPNVLNIPNSAY